MTTPDNPLIDAARGRDTAQQPEALRLAELIEKGNRRSGDASIAAELRRLHAREQELLRELEARDDTIRLQDKHIAVLEAAQAQRVPLNIEQIRRLIQNLSADHDEDGWNFGDLVRAVETHHGIYMAGEHAKSEELQSQGMEHPPKGEELQQ